LVIASVLPLFALGAYTSISWLQEKQESLRAHALEEAREILASADRDLFAQIELARLLGDAPVLREQPPDLARFHKIATLFAQRSMLWDRVILLDPSGQQVVNTAVPFGTTLPRVVDAASFEETIKHPTRTDVRVTPPGPFSPDGLPGVTFRVPVYQVDALRYVLTIVMKVRAVSRLADDPDLPQTWSPHLIDGRGKIVAAPRTPTLAGEWAAKEALDARSASPSGIFKSGSPADEAVAYVTSHLTDWSVAVAIPGSEYRRPFIEGLSALSTAVLLGLLCSGTMIVLIRRELAEQRIQALRRERVSRMEALGRMTGGVAHDFNNLLMVILGNIELLQRRLSSPPAEKYLQTIHNAAERGSQLTRELLSFSRVEPGQPATFDVSGKLRDLRALLQHSLPENIAIRAELAERPLPVRADPAQFDLAIINIVLNARDAMAAGGALVLRTDFGQFPDRSGRHGVVVSISDTGVGIPKETLPHVFEPFFTTKQLGKGTGLGLSQVYGFAKAAGGLADIESRVGQGTTVRIFLPASEAERAKAKAPAIVPAVCGEHKRVLLVDDDADIRSIMADALSEMGFNVAQAADAAEALLQLQTAGFDILVSDIVMPGGMNGCELVRRARARWPQLAVLLISGYTDSPADAPAAILKKPFVIEDLAARIQELAVLPAKADDAEPRAAAGGRH
jgi:signal transduction histidine kinase